MEGERSCAGERSPESRPMNTQPLPTRIVFEVTVMNTDHTVKIGIADQREWPVWYVELFRPTTQNIYLDPNHPTRSVDDWGRTQRGLVNGAIVQQTQAWLLSRGVALDLAIRVRATLEALNQAIYRLHS